MSLCPCNVGLHKPVSGPLHEADLGNLQSKGTEPLFPSSTPPSPGPRVPSPPDAASPPPSPCFWTDAWEIWKLMSSRARAPGGDAGVVV